MPGLHRERRLWLFALSIGALGTFQYHLTQFSSKFDTFFGDRGDARGIVALGEHWHQALRGQANLLSPGMFYPVKGTLAYSEFLLGFGVPYSIVRTTGLGMFSSLEVVVIVLSFLNYLACFVLLYRVLRFHFLASCAGALFFAFNSPKFFQMSHLQLQFVVCLPLIFIFVLLFVKHRGTLNQKRAFGLLFLAGLALNIQLMTAFYLGWFFSLWCFLFLILALLFQPSRRFIFSLGRKFWPAISAGAATFLLGAIPFMLVYLPRASEQNWYTYSNVSEMIPSWWSLLSMGEGNYVWGWLASIVRPKPAPTYWAELTTGIGVFTSLAWIGITIFGLWTVVKILRSRSMKKGNEGRPETLPVYLLFLGLMILATTLFYCMGMKYGNGHSLWKYVYNYFPGAKSIRAMSRYVIFLTLPMAVGFGFALDYGIKQVSRQKTSLARSALMFGLLALAALGVFEQFGTFKVGGTGFSKKAETAYLNAMAAKLDRNCAAFYVAARPDDHHGAAEYQYDAMMIAVMTQIPTLNGTSSQFPTGWFGLYRLQDPAYEENVRRWLETNNVRGNICRVELSPPVEAFDPKALYPLDNADLFVRQHYRDLEGREPTEAELSQWVQHGLKACVGDASCRAQTALNLLRSTEFYKDGSLILRLYEVGLGRMPRYDEFMTDLTQLRSALATDGESARDRFVDAFTSRPEFAARYQGLSDIDYQMKLYDTAQLQSYSIITSQHQTSRGQVLRRIVEGADVSRELASREWVALHYFGYLRRDPDQAGFVGWVNMLDATGDFRRVTEGFVTSIEYRLRVSGDH